MIGVVTMRPYLSITSTLIGTPQSRKIITNYDVDDILIFRRLYGVEDLGEWTLGAVGLKTLGLQGVSFTV